MLLLCRAPNCQRTLGHPGQHSAPKPTTCAIETCVETDSVLRLVSLAAWYGEDAPVRLVCGLHFDQWALAVREHATPQWVAMMPANL
jgi:hypothetical protein